MTKRLLTYSTVLFTRKTSSNAKRKPASKLRVNYESSDINSSSADNDEEAESTLVVKKNPIARQAIERNAATRQRSAATIIPPATAMKSLEQLSLSSAGPSYSAEALKELRTSTPNTPKDVGLDYDPLDIASKFANDRAQTSSSSDIPDPSVVAALKARRAMMAANPDYISLSATNTKHESRLQTVGGDEEAFLQSFVEDESGGGLKTDAEKAKIKKQAIREAIDSSGSEESDDEEMQAWESMQIRSGGYSSMKVETLEHKLKKSPAVMAPLPTLANVVGKLEGLLAGMMAEKDKKERIVEELTEQRAQIEKREKEVQELLRVKGEAYERLRRDVGGAKEVGRGLESFGDDKSVTMIDV